MLRTLHTPRNPRKKTTLGAKLGLVLGSSLMSLLAIEVCLRLFGWAGMVMFVPSPEWGYLMTPSQTVSVYGHPIRINALGFRGPEIETQVPSGTKRIVFIGDSITYGGGRIREDQLFCRIVASLALREGTRVEVVNISAPAWSPQNWWRFVDNHGLYDADIVVLVLPECDLARPFATMSIAGHRAQASPLRLGNVLFKAQEILAPSRPAVKPDRNRPAQIAAANADVVNRLRERVGPRPFLAVLVPTEPTTSERFWPLFEAHLPQTLDLRNDLQDQGLFMDGVHLNARGHQLVAERIFARLHDALGGQGGGFNASSSGGHR